MPVEDQLRQALGVIDGKALMAEFLADAAAVATVATGCERLALWANVLRFAESDNPAAPFLFEMQRSAHDVAALLASALYVPAAAAMRATCETALYYSYFRTHIAELSTLAARPEYFVSKAEVLDFHKEHSPHYRKAGRDFGLPTLLDSWYSRVSAVVHGQLPGTWGQRIALQDTKHDLKVLKVALAMFTEGVEIIHLLLLLTVGAELWARFHHEAKKVLLKGMPSARRSLLELDGKS